MRFLTLLLTLLLVFSLVACGGSEESSTPAFSNANSTPKEESKVSSSTVESSVAESSAVDSSVVESSSVESSTVDSSDESSEDEEPEVFEPVEYDDYEIKKAPGAVEIDGVISDGEYETVFEFDADELIWSTGSTETVAEYEPKLYISWDEKNLYTAVALIPGRPRTFDNENYAGAGAERPYLFDRRHVMCAVLLGDPTDPKYIPPVGASWDWQDAYNTGFANEWAISAQPNGDKIYVDYFGLLTEHAGWKYELLPGSFDIEVYEQAIPWEALAGGVGYEAKAGNVIGYAFSALCEEANLEVEQGEDENAVYAGFGGGINNGKNFAHYVGLTLAD